MEIIILDGMKLTTRDKAYDYINRIMRFPDYAGKNLDALHDCLSEFGKNRLIIFMNTEVLEGFLATMAEVIKPSENCICHKTGKCS